MAAAPSKPERVADSKHGGTGEGSAQAAKLAAAACLECGRADALLQCSRCGAPYCSQECQRRAWKGHRPVCQRPARDAPSLGEASSSSTGARRPGAEAAAPALEKCPDLKAELTGPLRVGWREYLAERGASRRAEVEKIKELEAFGLAILQALQRMPERMPLEATNGRCVVWVLGARDGIEKRQILLGGWEPLFSSLEVAWDIVLVGPELQEDMKVCVAPGRRVYTYACLAHEAKMEEHLRRPSFVSALNTGIGASVVHHMRSWIPTLGELLLLGRPVLFTCFGMHEAKVEDQIFKAMQASFAPHQEGGFSYVLEPDKPLSVCNALFTWVHGSRLSPAQLQERAIPFVDAQLRSAELFHFLKEARSHVNILADPEGAAHSNWAAMYDGRFVPCLKQALEEDDDDRGGVQTIVRCSMKTVASASRSPLAAAVLLDMGIEPALASFRSWAHRGHWTRHDWMVEEVVQRLEETETLLRGAGPRGTALDVSGGEPEEPFVCTFRVRASAAVLRKEPARDSPVVAKVQSGRVLRTRSRRGLWLRAAHGGREGWILGYHDKTNAGDMTDWDILGWEP
uniref:MYND-type domain-containing protein n=1 Tax=Alexandrium monilatum TaxID=311494 RepID=A0A7S4SDH3_9DINO